MSEKRFSDMTDDDIRAMAAPDATRRVNAMTDGEQRDFLLRLSGYDPDLLIRLLDKLGPQS